MTKTDEKKLNTSNKTQKPQTKQISDRNQIRHESRDRLFAPMQPWGGICLRIMFWVRYDEYKLDMLSLCSPNNQWKQTGHKNGSIQHDFHRGTSLRNQSKEPKKLNPNNSKMNDIKQTL